MSLPIICIFERHWDTYPKEVLLDVLPDLAQLGYNTLCVEAPEDVKKEEILNCLDISIKKSTECLEVAQKYLSFQKQIDLKTPMDKISYSKLAELMRLYVTSQKYQMMAEWIKNLPGHQKMKEVFDKAQQHKFELHGIDISEKSYNSMFVTNQGEWKSHFERDVNIIDKDAERIRVMTNHLSKLKKENRGIVFLCGAYHVREIFAKFKKMDFEGEALPYFICRGDQVYDEQFDEIGELEERGGEILNGHVFRLQHRQIKTFGEKIINEVMRKIPDRLQQIGLLNSYFEVEFEARMRPGYYVDAVLDLENVENIDSIKQKLKEKCIDFSIVELKTIGKKWLIIKDINFSAIAKEIASLYSISGLKY